MSRYNAVVLFFLFCTCTVPVRSYLENSASNNSSKGADIDSVGIAIPDSSAPKITTLPGPQSYAVEQWVGKDFVVLDKQQLFKNFGYELFLNNEMERCTAPIDISLQLKNHRIRCDIVSGHTLICKNVMSAQGEWVVTFLDTVLNKEIWAKTYKKAIKDISLKSDLDQARRRWLGRTVFSKRGVISTIDNNNGYGSLKVMIQDSLHVVDICWGVTPLPVKPLWLMVETREQRKGFIPIRISWTNLMVDQVQQENPWDEDIFERDPSNLFKWDASMWEVINNHRVVNEMSPDQVITSWGKPLSRGKKELNGTVFECWKYQSQTLYFGENGVVSVMNE